MRLRGNGGEWLVLVLGERGREKDVLDEMLVRIWAYMDRVELNDGFFLEGVEGGGGWGGGVVELSGKGIGKFLDIGIE